MVEAAPEEIPIQDLSAEERKEFAESELFGQDMEECAELREEI